ncbi:replicative DNA helicase [Mycobacterium helveticum]|uniref:Replicative DNA helicase n=1 Tax=Mycobacterium helveticum TaxID=2592811 RepID=A0A557XC50_9MYCO|nr:replicative DNA helicase [Mycobacterium helveticum]TVS77860.1 replicative DNA helicase [Mycobacterium helveticum]TVS83098.1 replicative DNA helicase [Mycobacterium helveticum]
MAVVDDLAPGAESAPPSEDFGRQPPQDLAAEQSVLGGMLLSKDAIADVLERLRPGDFYRPAHQNVYDAILDLYGRGEPADAVTVAAELDRRGLLRRIGGAPYLHTLISTVPTAANAGYYASIVAEKALLRRLVEAGTRVVQYGYAGAEGADVAEIVDRAQAEIYAVAERRMSEDFVPLEDLLQPTMDEIDAIASNGGIARGVPTGFTELDEVTNGLHPGQMIIVAARPGVGKSTLGLDFMRSCSIKHRMASVIFSLEMSKSEIVMRLLSAEAKIKLADMRSGRMSDDDWTRLARRMSEISEAPLYIDDSPNLTMMEIRAKARRLRQKADLKLVVVDYLQLMTSGKKVESRQIEVSEFSRHLKLLAKELEVPVVAISQLNRGPEQRTDKKPLLSDLRESGCLTAATRILRADTGAEVTFGELMRTGERPWVWSLDERMRMVARPMTNVFPSGHKEVLRLRLASGREVEATGNHPFMKLDGWTPLEQLQVGDRIAAPRLVPEPFDTQRMDESEVILLAHMIGDGSCVKRQPIRYASVDEANLGAVTIAAAHFGVRAVRDEYPAARVTTLRLPAPERLTHGKRNPIAAWLDGLGLFGKRSYEKFVPEPVFRAPNDQVALFLRHLWATDGSVRWDDKAGQGRIYYASTSRRLIDDVAQLLLRVGVFARIKRATKLGYRDGWHLCIYGAENQARFLRHVGVHGVKAAAAQEVLARLEGVARNTNLDTVPKEVWVRVREALSAKQMTHRGFAAAMGAQFCGSTMWKHSPSRGRLHRAAALLDDPAIHALATNDVFWDTVAEITSLGAQDVYDGTVDGTHNFVANGISVHNSLEQDADMVILLNRPDAFERDDPRGGEADFILAKHRNGPTKTVTVAHQLHLSRFANMAR